MLMNDVAIDSMRETVDEVYRTESRRVFATLIRLLGDFDLAEDALHDAFAAALIQWSRDGVPANPPAANRRYFALSAHMSCSLISAPISDGVWGRYPFCGAVEHVTAPPMISSEVGNVSAKRWAGRYSGEFYAKAMRHAECNPVVASVRARR